MTLTGIKLRVVGRDATRLCGRDSTNSSYATNTVALGRRRELRRDLQGAGPLDRRRDRPARHVRALQPHVHPGRQPRRRRRPADGGARLPGGATPAGPEVPQQTGPWRETGCDERSDHDASIHAPAAPARAGAAGGSPCWSPAASWRSAGARPAAAATRDRQPERRRLHDGRRRGTNPTFNLTTRPGTSTCRTGPPPTRGATPRAPSPSSTPGPCCASTRATPSR